MRNRRICTACNKQVLRHHKWRMVEAIIQPSRWHLFLAFLRGKLPELSKEQVAQHWDCDLPHVPKTTIQSIDHSLQKVFDEADLQAAPQTGA